MNLKSFRQNRLFHSFIWLASVVLIPTSANAAIAFTDATTDAGGFNAGERWGASWGDINGDGRPDLYVNNHRIMPSLYRNNGDGTFTEVAQEVDISKTWITTPKEDLHGATWVDFDNDGDDDLYVSVSVGNDSQFMVNTDGVFTNKSVSAGLIGHTESRMPIWLDYSGDGYLDVIDMSTVAVVNKQDPATGTFSVDTSTGLSCTKRMNYGQLVDLNNNGSMEFLCINEGLFPQKIYDTATVPFTDVTYLVPKAYNVNDTITADFNNDLLTDMFLTRGRLRPNQALIINNKRIEAWLDTLNKTELGFNFESNGIVTFNLDSRIKKSVNIAHIFYGSNGLNPADINFSLDPANADVAGIKPDRTAWGYYIGYNTTIQKWEVFYKPETDGRVYITVDTEATVSNLEATGLKNIDLPMSPQLLMNSASGLSFDTNAGVGIPVSCVSAATGDFDNDMDVDLYLVCRGGVENLPNILYENNNDGTFSPVALAGGAEGLVGAGLSSGAGTGESVVVADYNLDGFLDLFVTNGLLMRPFGLGGSDQLFQNNANSNRWIELDLQGTNSNRNGIGAKVIVTAGGIKQLREQNGGYHRWSQNHQRLHFGLGTNSVIENIEILWPNGQTTQHTDVDTNKLYTATEDGLLTERVLGDPSGPAIQKDDECGPPTYSAGTNRGFYLWKDCATSSWLVRIPGGNNNNIIRYTGSIKSSTQFVSTTPISLESGDSLDDTDPLSIEFDFTVSGSSEDGFNFNIPTNNFCLTLDTPQNMTVYLGAKTRSIRTPFNLETLQHCGAATSSSLSIGQAVVINEGSGSASFTVTLDSPATTPVTVSYATADITAQSGQDYTSTSGTLTIPASSTSASIQVPVTDDSLVEGDEEFSINLSNPTGASIGVASSFATITDNDTSALTANNVSAAENTASVDIAVTLSTASNQVITVDYSTTDGTATAGNDYVSQSGTLTFNAGDTSKTISVNLTDDSLSEGPESFSVTLSSPSNATIEKASATVSLTDNEASACGEPAYDAATEKGIYLWKDCSTQLWSIRTLGGGSSSALKYKGAISSNQAISNVAGFSIEASDIYDNSTNSLQLDFLMRMQGAGVDGGSFTLASGASACLEITSAPSGSTVYIGSARTAYTAPIDLSTLGSCAVTPEISIADASVSETANSVDLTVSLSVASTQTISVNYATSDNTATAGNDYVANSGSLTFNAGETSKTLTINLIDDSLSEGAETFSVTLSAPVNATVTDNTSVVSINDNEVSACGEPAFDAKTENGFFVWQNCTTGQWSIRTLGGGSASAITYSGNILSNQAITGLAGFSMETGDVYDNTTNTKQLDYKLRMQGAGVDGGSFTLASGASACLEITAAPSGSTVYIGSARTAYTAPIDLSTLGSCAVTPGISIADASISETANSVDLTVSLSVASTQTISVNYATSDNTATAGNDYVANSGSLTFNAGETSKTLTISLIDDSLSEGAEAFSVTLYAPVNATVTDNTSVVSINDNEVSACGEPAFDAKTENGFFVWQDCTTGQWSIRTLGGGSASAITYSGNILSNQAITGLAGFSMETGDVYDNTANTKQLDYTFRMQGAGVDGGSFTLASGASACLEITSAPSGSTVYIGSARTAYTTPIDLSTLNSCAATPGISIADASVSESASSVDLTVSLSVASTQTVSVNYATSDNTATAGNDYIANSGSLTFNAGETSKTLTISLIDDSLSEGAEAFSVTLSAPVNADITDSASVVTINDNDGAPTLGVNGVTADESAGSTTVTVNLSIASSQNVSVNYALSDGTAIAGQDFTVTSGTLTFNPGETSKTVSVTILDDSIPENEETLTVTLSSAVNADIGVSNASITITDNDPAPSVTINDLSIPESIGTASTTVSLSHASALTVTVDYVSTNGTAVTGEDYSSVSGTVSFAPGETSASLDINIIDDSISEGTENLKILLSASDNATITDNSATVTITDDDAAPSLSVSDISISESVGTANVAVTLSSTSALTVTVNYSLFNNTAESGSDFDANSGALTFAPGITHQSIPVSIINDLIPESTESLSIALSSPANALIADGTSLVTITDDDAIPTIGINDVTVSEGASTNFLVTLNTASSLPVSIDYATFNASNTTSTVFFDNFESSTGWSTNPFGTDNATTGQWERGNPSGTEINGIKQQLTNTVSGSNNLVTGRNAGSSVGTYDIDSGVTSMRSPAIALPAGQQISIDFSYYLAHLNNSQSDDFFRVSIISSGTSVILEEKGNGQDKAAAWKTHTADISSFAGQTIRILIEAADNGTPSLVEAAMDDLRIRATTTNAVAGDDYTASTGTLTFQPGEVSKQINVPVLNDALNEFAEEFSVILSNPVNATINDGTGTAVIQ